MQSIYDYDDYRFFLKQCFDFLRQADPSFSLRKFAQKAQLSSHDLLSRVIQGKRNLNPNFAFLIGKALDMSDSQIAYFSVLVQFNQAETIDEKQYKGRRLEELHPNPDSICFSQTSQEYFDHWYHSVIRSLIPIIPTKQAKDFIKKITFKLSEKEVLKSFKVLKSLDLISETDSSFQLTANNIQSSKMQQIHASKLNNNMIELAQESLYKEKLNKRIISGTTLTLSDDAAQKCSQVIHDALQKIYRIAEEDSEETSVYQINIQYFPLSKNSTDLL